MPTEVQITADQLNAIFGNLSTQTAKITASNAALQTDMQYLSFVIVGSVIALIWAVTWKG